MCENYARSALRVSVAQICQVLGWDSVQLSACDLLSDVLDRYIQQLARSCHRYAELYGRTDPVLSDIGLAFGPLGVSLSELEDYVNHLEPVPFPQSTHLFPLAKSSTLQFPSPDEERRDYIPDYLPPLVSLQEEEEEEPVPVAMGTSAEAMQVSVEEEEEGEEEYDDEAENAENRPAKREREGDEAFALGVMPTAKRPRVGLGLDSSPDWMSEAREPLSSLNPQSMPLTPTSPPLSPAPTPGGQPARAHPATPGGVRKPPRTSLASPPGGRKSKSPRRGGGASGGSPGRTPKVPPKGKKKKGSPRSPRGGGAGGPGAQIGSPPLGAIHKGGRGGGGPQHADLLLQRSALLPDPSDMASADIEDSISAVIARACAARPHDPYDLPSDSDSDSDPSLSLPHALLGRQGKGVMQTPPTAGSKHNLSGARGSNLTSTPLFLLASTSSSMDRSIDEVVRQAGSGGKRGAVPMATASDPDEEEDDDLSSPPLSPQTPQPSSAMARSLSPWRRQLGQEDFGLGPSALLLPQEGKKKKPKKEAKLKGKKEKRMKEKDKAKDKGHEKGKSKDKKKEKRSKEKLVLRELALAAELEGRSPGDDDDPFSVTAAAASSLSLLSEDGGGRREKDKHRDKKRDKDKSKKDKAGRGRDKAKERGGAGVGPSGIVSAMVLGGPKAKEVRKEKKKKKMTAEERQREASLALFGPAACLLLPPSIPAVSATAAAAANPFSHLGLDKPLKSKEKEKKKDKKEKKKKKEKEREKEKEKERVGIKEKEEEKEGKKKGKEKEKGGKLKEKAKENTKPEKMKAVEPPVVLSAPVIPRLTLRVGAGQDKIVISKVVSESEGGGATPPPSGAMLHPPTRGPGSRAGPGGRGRNMASTSSGPPPVAPPGPIPGLVPHPSSITTPSPMPHSQALASAHLGPPPIGSTSSATAAAANAASMGAPGSASLGGGAKGGCSVVTETVSAYVIRDEWGNQIWICPGCNKPDDGSPMIGCDQCDDWYHWPCVGILQPPPEDQQWFCVKCAGKKTDKKQKKRRRKAN